MLHDDTDGGVLTNLEAGRVLGAAFDRAGQRGKVDLIFSDTCLNGMIEVTEQFKDFAHVIVASEDLEPGDGWEYQEWFRLMSAQPPVDPDEWGRQAVTAFGVGYEGRTGSYPCTLGAFRADNKITETFGALFQALQGDLAEGFALLDRARRRTQSFANHDTYDIKDFLQNVEALAADERIRSVAAQGVKAFDEARVH